MDEDIKFEELSSIEQEKKLKSVMEQIKLLQKAEIISGEVDIADISFFRLPSGEVSYDVAINNPDGTIGHMYYQESNNTISKIDVEKSQNEVDNIKNQLAVYSNSGMDLALVENELMTKEQFLASLHDPRKISLTNLEITRKECMDLAIQLGMDFDEIEAMLVLQGQSELALSQLSPEEMQKIQDTIEITGIDEQNIMENIEVDNGKVSFDSKVFDTASTQGGPIVGGQKVTSNYTFNQIIGLDYDSYKILITKSGTPAIVGINKDGTSELIPDNRIEINKSESRSMSLLRDNGTIKNVGVVMSFKIKDSGSSIGRDQAIGLYADNGSINSFYARNANGDKMIGEELPGKVYTPERVHNERILDTKYNRDISSEAESAAQRTDDGCLDNVRNLGNGQSDSMYEQKDADELAEEYAKKYDIDIDKLKERFDYELENNHQSNTTDEKLMKQIAEEMDQEERHEPSREPIDGPKHF